MDKRNLAFGKRNFILLAVGLVVVVIGFLLMTGHGSTEAAFEPDIFSFRRVKLAPTVTLFGFLFIVYAVIANPGKGAGDCRDNTPE